MNYEALAALVAQGEGLNIEFKLKARHPEKFLKEISAFANTKGGHLLIGVEDNGKIHGLTEAIEDAYIVQSYVERYMQPVPSYKISTVAVSRTRFVVDVKVLAGAEKPYYVLPFETQPDQRAYIRLDHQSIQASKEVRDLMKIERKSRDMKFQYGEKEKQLIGHLSSHPVITVAQFQTLCSLPRAIASRTLVLLTACHVLGIIPIEGKEDQFYLLPAIHSKLPK
jgi:predicted HTH transcriptional regulator